MMDVVGDVILSLLQRATSESLPLSEIAASLLLLSDCSHSFPPTSSNVSPSLVSNRSPTRHHPPAPVSPFSRCWGSGGGIARRNETRFPSRQLERQMMLRASKQHSNQTEIEMNGRIEMVIGCRTHSRLGFPNRKPKHQFETAGITTWRFCVVFD